jgi:myo-inositol-1(or 4)-monophosphatase
MPKEPFEFSKIQPYIREAGQIALSYYQTQLTRKRKKDNSPVTEADEAVEKFLIEKIQLIYPDFDCQIIGEESGSTNQGKEFAWAIDPIDGTRIFLDGLPSWCISVGLLRNGEAYRGAVYLPLVNEMYYTDDEGKAFWNGEPMIGTLRTDWDSDSFIAISASSHIYFDIDFRRLRAFGAIATHHIYVARGVAVAALHRQTALWDIAGAQAILTAVGGVAVYLDGTEISMPQILADGKTNKPILVGHPAVVEKLLPKIKWK